MPKIDFKKIATTIALLLVLVAISFVVSKFGGNDDKNDNSTQATSQISMQESSQSSTQASSEKQSETQKVTQKETQKATQKTTQKATQGSTAAKIDEKGIYTSKEDVALYLHTYGKLPSNFITKSEAQKLGWTGGGLDAYAKNKCIGGDKFGNYDGLLPKGEQYYECDIDTLNAKSRGAKRLVFTKSGNIYYTEDHYETFKKLY